MSIQKKRGDRMSIIDMFDKLDARTNELTEKGIEKNEARRIALEEYLDKIF